MKPDKLNPDVSVKIAGQSHQLRWDKAAQFEMGNFPESAQELDESNHFACWRRACIYLFCMLQGDHPYKTPKQVAGAIADDEQEGALDAINKALLKGQGGKGEDAKKDPLSVTGPSPAADSD